MENMTILEYLAFTDNVNPKLKETLKKIYFTIKGGKEATLNENKSGISCVIDVSDLNDNHGGYIAKEPYTKTTIQIDKTGNITHKNTEHYQKENKTGIKLL